MVPTIPPRFSYSVRIVLYYTVHSAAGPTSCSVETSYLSWVFDTALLTLFLTLLSWVHAQHSMLLCVL